ncbi:PiggyBac transposable element-derived protein 4 [Eumeta japonica]|uniref:PiggyBac transposable element-derived protein 4 n=1 Tax=Eumeta variegata TaxID=151549 RepID=A0A4C1UW40_EUMVA|nr:PiggyBac transposable element-derived protein 4 [Eumeta japonica]
MKSLFDNCIYASGTVRRQRADLPKIVKSKKKLKLKKGEHKWRVKGLKTDGTKTDVGCPAVVKQYTKRMGGVDHFDHIKGTYSVGRRSRRWWLRIFYFLLDACITNAFILYSKNSNSTKLSNLEFRIALARGLIGGFSSRKRRSEGVNYIVRKKVAVSDNYQKSVHMIAPEIRFSNVGEHMPVDLPSYQRCRHCSTKIKDKRSKIMCCKCGVPLCITPCFLNFHRQAPA